MLTFEKTFDLEWGFSLTELQSDDIRTDSEAISFLEGLYVCIHKQYLTRARAMSRRHTTFVLDSYEASEVFVVSHLDKKTLITPGT